MQKATYYDSSAIYGGYPYQAANGFGYNAMREETIEILHYLNIELGHQRRGCIEITWIIKEVENSNN